MPAAQVPEVLARFPGARTAKVKVAEPGRPSTTTSPGWRPCAR
ncbi:o-succinylbenzoate synthase domain protein [Mycobacterium xenopi 3993]|nr:o-succinylbenzoate synthase domain protein [Mycobacterium xenopi 3993]